MNLIMMNLGLAAIPYVPLKPKPNTAKFAHRHEQEPESRAAAIIRLLEEMDSTAQDVNALALPEVSERTVKRDLTMQRHKGVIESYRVASKVYWCLTGQ